MSETQTTSTPPPGGGQEVQQQQGGGNEWLPETYRTNPAFQNFKGVEDLAKSYENAARMTGMDRNTLLPIPRDENDAAGWETVYSKMGRPNTPTDYGIQPTNEAEKAMWSEALPELHRMGLTKRQVEGMKTMLDGMGARYAEQMSDPGKAMETFLPRIGEALASEAFANRTDNMLRQTWGQAYDQKMHAANRVVAAMVDSGNPEIAKLFQAPDQGGYGLANLPAFVQMMAVVGERMMEPGGLIGGGASGGQGTAMTPEQGANEVGRLSADKEFRSKLMAGDPEAQARWKAANEAMTGRVG